MGVGTFFHHIGTGLLLVATALLIVVSVTSPVVNDLSLLKVNLRNGGTTGDSITFGTFGYCELNVNGGDNCARVHVGYDPTPVLEQIAQASFSNADRDATRILTRVFVLHPVAAGLAFLAFLLCLGTSFIGSFVASLFSALAFIVTLVVMACDFACFEILKHGVNSNNLSTSHANWGPAIWCVLVAAICTLVAAILVFVTCCAGRTKRNRNRGKPAY